mmetsp:Transcript_33978/g.44854  ORF Transcript_33978/g.44854 Transcript_33978/m.44854 type:complete len:197 (+) Transcript_33978:146-736(+)|eukprot:CAMPEP_0117759478 /NCGR_PEP_ID=MMETSP0947-20121206/16034_1 /TAXON_ID=44440 /ORGANISM="Chattonella subsalsa, Strain CCMP2191" /LENGTH=196 /DNA_ID=CAMNT_0005579937 /DNA_START=143 /DNA_END=736 /DNA_ORIENTATION=-
MAKDISAEEAILSDPPTKSNLTSEAFYSYSAGNMFSLPHFKKLELPAADGEMLPFNPNFMAESCVMKSILGVGIGAGMGFAMGIFLGAMGDLGPPISVMHGREVPQAPAREQLRMAYKATLEKSIGWAKNFAVVSAVFAGTECVIEKYRGKHDMMNPIISGCAAGAILSASQGPQAAAMGCMGFAAFSGVIELILH